MGDKVKEKHQNWVNNKRNSTFQKVVKAPVQIKVTRPTSLIQNTIKINNQIKTKVFTQIKSEGIVKSTFT